MNCKPGDLAVIVKALDRENIGRFVRVICSSTDGGQLRLSNGVLAEFVSSPGGGWIVESEGSALAWRNFAGHLTWTSVRAYADECLRPIRPGSITDEEVRELYAPKEPVYA